MNQAYGSSDYHPTELKAGKLGFSECSIVKRTVFQYTVGCKKGRRKCANWRANGVLPASSTLPASKVMRSASLFFILSTQSSADVPTTHRVVTSILAFCAVSLTYFTKSSHLAFSEVDLTHHLKLIGAKKIRKIVILKKHLCSKHDKRFKVGYLDRFNRTSTSRQN